MVFGAGRKKKKEGGGRHLTNLNIYSQTRGDGLGGRKKKKGPPTQANDKRRVKVGNCSCFFS